MCTARVLQKCGSRRGVTSLGHFALSTSSYPVSAIIQAAYLVIISKRRHIGTAATGAWVVLCIIKTANIRRWNIDQRASCRHASGPLASERSAPARLLASTEARERGARIGGFERERLCRGVLTPTKSGRGHASVAGQQRERFERALTAGCLRGFPQSSAVGWTYGTALSLERTGS